MAPNETLVIRADADSRIGIGHVMRCLALAQTWQEGGGRVLFHAHALPPTLHDRLIAEGFAVSLHPEAPGSEEDAACLIHHAMEARARWVVVDGYQFAAGFQHGLKDAGLSVLWLDDYGHSDFYDADLVLNQNSYADAAMYARRREATRLLLGARYVLLRREFRELAPAGKRLPPVAHRLLVTLGGGDPDNITRRVLEAVSSLGHPDLEVVAVVGAANPHRESLQELADASGHRIRLEHDSNHMAELMAWADVAVSAGGSTCWELALMGVPALVMVLADNQRLVAEDLHRRGVVLNLGEAGDITAAGIAVRLEELIGSPEKRAAMSREGRALVDGRGCERVVRCLKAPGFHLRAAEPEDCKLLWQWVNEPTVRQSAFDSREIPWEDHVRWFERALADTHCVIFLAVTPDGTPLGQVRFDLRQNEADCEAEVDVSIAVQMRGQGVGVPMLDLAVDRIFSTTDVHLVKALVRPENEPSLRLFQTCGFVRVGPTLVKGCPAVRFHRERLQ